MIRLEPVTPRHVEQYAAVRLRALADSPTAFGSTYAKESAFTPEQWLDRVRQWTGERATTYLAIDGQGACGLAGCFLDDATPTQAHLISMWVAPTHRQRGAGRQLVRAVTDWAAARDVQTLRLDVTSNNAAALAFYARLGFARTGVVAPYPNDASLVEYEMSGPVAQFITAPRAGVAT